MLCIDGFKAHVLGKRAFIGFGDADIKASKTDRLHAEDFFIQVKHHSGETGRWGLQQLLEIKKLRPREYSDYQLVLVTTGEVSEEDKEHAGEKDIMVLNGKDLADWIYDSLPKLSPETKIALGISGVPQILN